ncbi:dihydrolipoyl dehydrogenase [Candidatus Zixiibacteriota bacterium]
MASKEYDAVVIGAGPGGYVCAIRLAQLGKKVLCVESHKLGGVCLNYGCIPSKALISTADLYYRIDSSKSLGITVGERNLDFGATQKFRERVVKRMTGGVKALFESNGIDVLTGMASFRDANTLQVATDEGEETVAFTDAVIATGSVPFFLKGFEPDGDRVVGSKKALEFEAVPESLLVIGGGYIGLELGIAYAKFGTKVTVIEMMESLLPLSPKNLSTLVEKRCRKLKIDVHLGTAARELEKHDDHVTLVATGPGDEELRFDADRLLVTIGRTPNTAGLELQNAGLETVGRGFIEVDEHRRTAVSNIYAIGDVAGEPMLAHKASKEGLVAAEVIAGLDATYAPKSVPAVIFTDPEVAYVGLSEEEAVEAGFEVTTGEFPFMASGRAAAINHTDGFVKVIGDAKTGVVLGVQIVGPEASDLISEACLAIEAGLTLEDIGHTMHPHPTLGEVVMEAAETALGKAIHGGV